LADPGPAPRAGVPPGPRRGSIKGKLIREDAHRTFAVILNTDDEVVGCLTAFAKEQRLSASQFDLNGPVLISADAGQSVDWLAQFCAT
jgi:hypothetical protein